MEDQPSQISKHRGTSGSNGDSVLLQLAWKQQRKDSSHVNNNGGTSVKSEPKLEGDSCDSTCTQNEVSDEKCSVNNKENTDKVPNQNCDGLLLPRGKIKLENHARKACATESKKDSFEISIAHEESAKNRENISEETKKENNSEVQIKKEKNTSPSRAIRPENRCKEIERKHSTDREKTASKSANKSDKASKTRDRTSGRGTCLNIGRNSTLIKRENEEFEKENRENAISLTVAHTISQEGESDQKENNNETTEVKPILDDLCKEESDKVMEADDVRPTTVEDPSDINLMRDSVMDVMNLPIILPSQNMTSLGFQHNLHLRSDNHVIGGSTGTDKNIDENYFDSLGISRLSETWDVTCGFNLPPQNMTFADRGVLQSRTLGNSNKLQEIGNNVVNNTTDENAKQHTRGKSNLIGSSRELQMDNVQTSDDKSVKVTIDLTHTNPRVTIQRLVKEIEHIVTDTLNTSSKNKDHRSYTKGKNNNSNIQLTPQNMTYNCTRLPQTNRISVSQNTSRSDKSECSAENMTSYSYDFQFLNMTQTNKQRLTRDGIDITTQRTNKNNVGTASAIIQNTSHDMASISQHHSTDSTDKESPFPCLKRILQSNSMNETSSDEIENKRTRYSLRRKPNQKSYAESSDSEMSDDTNSTSDESFNIGSDSDATEEENTEDKKLETRRSVRYEKDLKEGVRTDLIQIPVSTGSSCEQKLCNNAPTANISVPAHVCVKNSNVHFLESETDIRSKRTNTFPPKSATDLMYDTAISKRTQQNHNGFPLNKTINSPLELNAVVKTENVSLAFEGQVTSFNFPRVSKVALSSENLPYVVEGAVKSENLSRISEGAVISENLSRIPEGAVTSENLSRIPEGAVTTENLSRIPEGAVTSEGDKEMFIDQTSNLRQGKIIKNKKGIKFEFIFGEEGTFERCEIDNPILKMCVHDNSEAFRNCFKYMEWNCYMRCFHCEEVFERFSEYIFHSFGSEQCGDENKREVNGVVNGRWKACRMCGRQAFTKYKWLEHMLKDKIHGPEKKCAFIPKSAVLDPKEINGADFRKLKRNKRLQNKGKEDKRDKNAQVQPKLIQTDSESLKNFIPGFQCKVCGQSADVFPNLCDAVNHIKEVHTSEEKTPLKYAKVVSDDGRKVIVAEKMEDTKPSFLCSQCGNTYSCKGTLVIHLASAHKDVPSEKLGITDKTKKCPHCDKTFSVHHNRYYKRHLLIHTGPVTCKECNRLFKHKAAYLRHAIAHNGKQYICDKCGKVHESYINYRNHLNNHLLSESVRKFKCETCGKFFMTQNHLNTHARIHLPDRPFKCAHCDATFKFKNHLKNHLRSYCPKMKN